MANKSVTSPTAAKIYAQWKREGDSERPRNYLGASIIGNGCEMYLWLYFRNIVRENFDGRMFRLFDRGKREEAVFCADLRRIGCEVKEFADDGQQIGVTDFGGHFGGHLDGIVRGLSEAPKQWFVAEFKTHSDASFKKLSKEGVEQAKPMHYAQMTVYMGKTGLKKALYMAVNKDNDDLWCEVIDFNQSAYDMILARAKHIIETCEPVRCATRPDDFRCKACQARSVCWHDAKQFVDPCVPTNCLTCCHSTADIVNEGASWTCRLGHPCSRTGSCSDHLFIPTLVSAEIVDGSPKTIKYRSGESKFTAGPGFLSSDELKRFGPGEVDGVVKALNAVPGSSVVASNSVEKNYESEEFWDAVVCTDDKVNEWCASHPFHQWNKPDACSEFYGIKYFEYISGDDRTLVVIDTTKHVGKVRTNIPPF